MEKSGQIPAGIAAPLVKLKTTTKFKPVLLWLFSLLTFLLFFRPQYALKIHGLWDEVCYQKLLFDFIGESHEGCYSDSHFRGVVFFWLPWALMAKALSFLLKDDFKVWCEIFVGYSSYFYFVSSLFLFSALSEKYYIKKNIKILSLFELFLLFLNVPIFYFAFHNNHLVHCAEFFLGLVIFYYLIKDEIFIALVLSALMVLLRLNNFPILFVVLGTMADRPSRKNLMLSLVAFFILISAGWLLADVGFYNGYNQTTFLQIVKTLSFEKARILLFASDWGMVWVNSFWLLSFFLGMSVFTKISFQSQACLVWMLSEFFLLLCWRGNARYFGHRYLIGSYVAALWVFLECLDMISVRGRIALKVYLLFSAGYLMLLSWVYGVGYWPWPDVDNYNGFQLPYITWMNVFSGTRLMQPIESSVLFSFQLFWKLYERNYREFYFLISVTLIHFLILYYVICQVGFRSRCSFFQRFMKERSFFQKYLIGAFTIKKKGNFFLPD